MLFYVIGNQVVGNNADPDNAPAGWAIAEGDDISPENAYFDGDRVAAKPVKPSPNAVWNIEQNSWQVPQGVDAIAAPDWNGLLNGFRGSQIFAKIFTAGGQTLQASQGYSLLMDTIASSHNIDDLKFAIGYIRAAMADTAVGDFTTEDLEWIRVKFEDNGFEPNDFALE